MGLLILTWRIIMERCQAAEVNFGKTGGDLKAYRNEFVVSSAGLDIVCMRGRMAMVAHGSI